MIQNQKVPREGLADLLSKLADHALKYMITGMSVSFDGTMYRVVVEGEGELLLPGVGSSDKQDPDTETENE